MLTFGHLKGEKTGFAVTVRQEIFAANNSRGFRGSKGSAKLFIREH